jgi:AraC family transcriptional regulator
MAWAARKRLLGPSIRALGIPHDDPEVIPREALRYDAALVVPEQVQAEGEIGIQVLGPGEYAVATHKGPYQRVGETYARLCGEWLPASGRQELAAPAFEVYRNSPAQTPAEDLLTDIHVPLAPEKG